MVNEVNMAKWIVALRSGKYKQGESRLRWPDDRFCCLGVACDVSNVGEWASPTKYDDDNGVAYLVAPDDVGMAVLPFGVSRWLGIAESDPVIRPDGSYGRRATAANDCYEMSFTEIADHIERTLLPGKKAEEILAGAQ